MLNKSNYLIITDLAYPMGGGEAYMRETCLTLHSLANCYWLSFATNSMRHKKDELRKCDCYFEIRSSSNDFYEQIKQTIYDVKPDLIHTQGPISFLVKKIAEELSVNCIVGYHFWSNFVNLESNINILENIKNVSISKNFGSKCSNVYEYVASDFMVDVYKACGGKEKLNVIYPLPNSETYVFQEKNRQKKYVLQMNLADLKGASVFFTCASNLKGIQFYGIISESFPQSFSKLRRLKNVVISEYRSAKDLYREAKIVMVPTQVDETFCRVAYEAVMNNIPVISSNKGFLKKLLGNTGIFCETADEYEAWLKKYFDNDEFLRNVALKQKAHVKKLTEKQHKSFLSIAKFFLEKSTNKNIGIYCPWGDSGLGNMMHLYSQALRELDYKVNIFSFQSYYSQNKALVFQSNPLDWIPPINCNYVYYSFNSREEVTVYELMQFIKVNAIRTLIVPEICWQKNWERLYEIKKNNVNIILIPMIEIVQKNEVKYHNDFDLTLCSTNHSFNILRKNNLNNLFYVGYCSQKNLPNKLLKDKFNAISRENKIKFIHVAGHSPSNRKNTKKIIEAFLCACKYRDDISLTISSQMPVKNLWEEKLPNQITLIEKNLSRKAIKNLYANHHISIQVSKIEGLGLGFYESLSNLCPVITLNVAPHNEFIKNKITGILIKPSNFYYLDNPNSLVKGSDFRLDDLVDIIVSVDKRLIKSLVKSTYFYFNKNLTYDLFRRRLESAIIFYFNRVLVKFVSSDFRKNMPIFQKYHKLSTPIRILMLFNRIARPLSSKIPSRFKNRIIDLLG